MQQILHLVIALGQIVSDGDNLLAGFYGCFCAGGCFRGYLLDFCRNLLQGAGLFGSALSYGLSRAGHLSGAVSHLPGGTGDGGQSEGQCFLNSEHGILQLGKITDIVLFHFKDKIALAHIRQDTGHFINVENVRLKPLHELLNAASQLADLIFGTDVKLYVQISVSQCVDHFGHIADRLEHLRHDLDAYGRQYKRTEYENNHNHGRDIFHNGLIFGNRNNAEYLPSGIAQCHDIAEKAVSISCIPSA